MASKTEKNTGGKLSIKTDSVVIGDSFQESRTLVDTSSDGLPIELNVVQESNAAAGNTKLSDDAHIILRVSGADGFRYFISTSKQGSVLVGPMSHDDSAPAYSQFANNRYGNSPTRPNNANVGADTVGLGLDEQLKKAALSMTFGRINGAEVPATDFDALAKIAREALNAVKVTPVPPLGKQI